jgi:hypothetical protein
MSLTIGIKTFNFPFKPLLKTFPKHGNPAKFP